MATHSSILAWEIPLTEEPGVLQSMGLQTSCMRLSNWAGLYESKGSGKLLIVNSQDTHKFQILHKYFEGPDCVFISVNLNYFYIISCFPTYGLVLLLLLAIFWRRQWHPTPVLLPGRSHGWRSLVGCSPWGRWELNMTEQLHFHFSLSCTGEGNGTPLQYSCLENPRDGGDWWAAIYGVAQSQTRLKRLSSSSSIGYIHQGLENITWQSVWLIRYPWF